MGSSVNCYKCSNDTELEVNQKVVKSDECLHCASDIHCCKMCKFYESSSYNECREPNADRITEKEKANYCSYFELSGRSINTNDKDEISDLANSLFKD